MELQKYKIRRVDDHEISPEETFADNLSGHSVVEVPISRTVFRIVYISVLMVMVLMLLQAWRLQGKEGRRYAALADQSRLNHYAIPALRGTIYDSKQRPLVENTPVFDLVAVRADLVKVPNSGYEDLLEKNKNNAIFTVQKNISKEEAIRIQAAATPGLVVVPYARRQYDDGIAFAHIVGYTAQITQEELTHKEAGTYQRNDRVGRLGIEASYESALHGEVQGVLLEHNQAVTVGDAKAGADVTLTIDKDVQEHLYRSIDQVFKLSGVKRGAVVVQNVKTGAILGMVSMPSFDPNLFESSGDEEVARQVSALLTDKNKPLFNRAISGLYAPGSTIKPLYALAALQEKIVDPLKQIYADGAIEVQSEVDPNIFYTFKDWKVHGWTDMRKAIANSVDVYFYALCGGYGDWRGMGIDTMVRYLRAFRADQKTGIDLPAESEGFVPSKQWKKETKDDAWYVGDTYNVSIGQGDLSVTPLWINSYVSALANGGSVMKPYLVDRITNSTTGVVEKTEPTLLTKVPYEAANIAVIRQGMRQTITDGTGQLLKGLPRAVAAKTGTAQVSGKALNSLFTVYGPYEDPEISMTVLVENIPQSQSLAMQVANNFLMWYFDREQ